MISNVTINLQIYLRYFSSNGDLQDFLRENKIKYHVEDSGNPGKHYVIHVDLEHSKLLIDFLTTLTDK